MARILAIGDPHFQTFHLHRAREFIDKLDAWLATKKYDAIVVLGDVLHDHERLHSLSLNLAVKWLTELRAHAKDVYVLVGNHDYINNGQFLTTNHWMNALKNHRGLHVVDDVVEKKVNDIPITLLPYVQPGRFQEALNLRAEDRWKKSKVIFGHQEFKGAQMGSCESDKGDDWSLTLPPVISGHIHGKQYLHNGIFYPGSSVPVSFSETSERIVAEIIISNGSNGSNGSNEWMEGVIVKEHNMGLTRLVSKNISVDDWDSLSLDEYVGSELKLKIDAPPSEMRRIKKTKKYQKLKQANVKIAFHRSRTAVKEENDRLRSVVQTDGRRDFKSILDFIVTESDDSSIVSMYNEILSSL